MEKQGLREHFLYLQALDANDRIVIAGPLGLDGGLVIFLARDQTDADSVIAAPVIKRRFLTIIPTVDSNQLSKNLSARSHLSGSETIKWE